MSAIAAILQSNAVHMMTDGLSYVDGVPFRVDCDKTIPLNGMRAALACTGPSGLGDEMVETLEGRFASFDAIVADGAPVMRAAFLDHVARYRGGDAIANLVLIGWHEAQSRPALYAMDLVTEGEKLDRARRLGRVLADDEAFALVNIECVSFPCPDAAQFAAARYDFAVPLNAKNPETELLHIMEIQRRTEIEGRFLVGGHATLTSIDADGLLQRVVHRWDEDRADAPIRPRPIDWRAWLAARAVAIVPDGLSRLQRERMEKKARKGTLRANRYVRQC